MNESFLIAAAIAFPFLVFVGFVVAGAARAEYHAAHAPCTPYRYLSMTASTPQPARRIVVQLASPATDYIVSRPQDVDAIKAGSVTYDLASLTAEPELPTIAIQGIPVDWPTRVVQPVPLQARK